MFAQSYAADILLITVLNTNLIIKMSDQDTNQNSEVVEWQTEAKAASSWAPTVGKSTVGSYSSYWLLLFLLLSLALRSPWQERPGSITVCASISTVLSFILYGPHSS